MEGGSNAQGTNHGSPWGSPGRSEREPQTVLLEPAVHVKAHVAIAAAIAAATATVPFASASDPYWPR